MKSTRVLKRCFLIWPRKPDRANPAGRSEKGQMGTGSPAATGRDSRPRVGSLCEGNLRQRLDSAREQVSPLPFLITPLQAGFDAQAGVSMHERPGDKADLVRVGCRSHGVDDR